MRPMLIPGARLLRRPDDRVQVGLDPDRRVVLPATAEVRASLRSLAVGEAAAHPRVVASLVAKEVAVPDDGPLRSALPPTAAGEPWVRHTLAAVAREQPVRFDVTLQRRAAHVVTVKTFGHPLSRLLADDLVALCARSGLRRPGRRRPGPRPRENLLPERPVAVLVGVGEPPREVTDDWVREGVPHLLLRLVEGRAVVGPFVVPGQTACLRCIDAHHTEEDQAWPLLVEQYSRLLEDDRSDGIPEPVDAALAALAVAWAARDLASYAEGATPGSLGSTIRVAPRLEAIETRRWPRHPRCGCSWT